MARGQRLRDNRDFRLWWGGTVVSSLGDEITIVAFPLVILLLTGSPLHAGLVGAVEAVPPLALALPIGVLVDRTSRRALLVGSAAVSMVSITSVALAFLGGEPALPHLYAVAFVNSLASTVYRIADTAALPRIVGRDQLGTAAGQNEAIWGVSAVTAPPLAGLLFEWAPAAPFLVDAATFAVVAGCVLGIRTRLGADRPYPSVRWRRDLTTGARTVLRQPTVRALTLLTVVGDVLFAGIGLLMIVLVREHGASAAQTGLVLAAPAVGSILGSLLASRLEDRLGLLPAVVGKHWATAALFALFPLDLPSWGVALVLGAISLQVAVLNVIQSRYLMSLVPHGRMGRVEGFLTFLGEGGTPLGYALTGAALDRLGAHGTLLAFEVVLLALAVAATVSRGLRAPALTEAEEGTGQRLAS